MAPLLPAPDGGKRASDSTERAQPHKAAGPKIPSIEELCAMFLQLNGLVMMKIITPAQANVIQRGLGKVLDAQQKRGRAGEELSEETLVDLCRQDPKVIGFLEPFLTEEQVAYLMGVVKDESDGPT